MRICVICQQPFETKRSNGMTCTNHRCRKALYRLRQRMEASPRAVIIHDPAIAALEKRFPDIGKTLRTLKAVFGEHAVGLALEAVNIVGTGMAAKYKATARPAPRYNNSSAAPMPPAA